MPPRTEAHGTSVRRQSPTYGSDLSRVYEEQAGVQEGGCAGLEADAVLLSQLRRKNAVDHMEKPEPKPVIGVGVEVCGFVVLIASDGRGCDADEQEGNRRRWIRDLIDAESRLEPERPTIETLVAGRNSRFTCGPELQAVRRL